MSKTDPVMMALSKVALSSSDLKKMDEEKSSGSDVVSEYNSYSTKLMVIVSS